MLRQYKARRRQPFALPSSLLRSEKTLASFQPNMFLLGLTEWYGKKMGLGWFVCMRACAGLKRDLKSSELLGTLMRFSATHLSFQHCRRRLIDVIVYVCSMPDLPYPTSSRTWILALEGFCES